MKPNFKMIAALALFFISIVTFAQKGTVLVKGSVFVDANNNGQRDANENGLKGVVVSDQAITVTTDDAGSYQLSSKKNLGFVMLTQPEGFTTKGSFWKKNSGRSGGDDRLPIDESYEACEVHVHSCF